LIYVKQDKNSLTQNNTQELRFEADFCSVLKRKLNENSDGWCPGLGTTILCF
jgi:hypothetical protein